MPELRSRIPSLSIGVVAAGLVISTPGLAQINSYGSGLYSSETLSTPPERRHGGYWNSTSQNQRQHTGERAQAAAPQNHQNASTR